MKPMLAALVTALLLTQAVSAQTPPPANEPVYDQGNGITRPRVTKSVTVGYSTDAMRRKLSGAIKLRCIVSSDGTTRDLELVTGLEEQMDENAVAALKQWTFEPGQREGTPAAVRITVDMTFTAR
jgi:TonB family protein